MTVRKIIFVPGKNLKPEPKTHYKLLKQCLMAGLLRANNAVAAEIEQQGAFELCAWNYEFYGEYREITFELDAIDRLLTKTEASLGDKLQVQGWRKRLSLIAYNLGDKYPWLANLFADENVKLMLQGTNQYFENHNGVAEKVRSILREQLLQHINREHKVLLIAHSMGSIIAYDSIFQISQMRPEQKDINMLLTIGSPLGTHYVQKRLMGYSDNDSSCFPGSIKDWVNISAKGDMVSMDQTLHDDFNIMLKHGLINTIEDRCNGVFNWYRNETGINPHSAYGYLINPQLTEVILNWWQQNES